MKRTLAELQTAWRKAFGYDPVRRRSRLPGPNYVQVQTVDACNGACRMCPYSTTARSAGARVMAADLYERLLGQLRASGTVRGIVLMLQNEPLLDPLLAERARRAKAVLGRWCRVAVVTNGTLLTLDRTAELLDAGLDSIDVSIDAYREQTYRAIRPGLDFGGVVENTRRLLANRRSAHVRVRFLAQRANEGEQADFVRYWRSLGAHVFVSPVMNRAGAVRAFDRLRGTSRTPMPWKRRAAIALGRLVPVCLAPFTSLCVLVDGRVILCCHDWVHEETYGDLSAQSLSDVWNGDHMNESRQLLWAHRPEGIALCRQCCRLGRD